MKFLLIVCLLLAMPAAAFAEGEEVTRLHDHTFNTDQTWSGTVLIDGIVQFAPEATLTIMPGTKVKFTRVDTDRDGIGENEIYIQGRLIAKGTKASPILFTSDEEIKRPGDWGAINIMVSEGKDNVLENCIIEYSYRGFHMHFSRGVIRGCRLRENYLGIQCQDSELEVSGCDITRNKGAVVFKDSRVVIRDNKIYDNYWGIRFLYGTAEITGNTITGNIINGITFRENKVLAKNNVLRDNRKGFSSDMSEVVIAGNVVTGNDESGLYLKHSTGDVTGNELSQNGNAGVSIEDSDVRISGNNINSNGLFSIDNNGSMDVDASGNWWGNVDADTLAGSIYDKADDSRIGGINVTGAARSKFVIKAAGRRDGR